MLRSKIIILSGFGTILLLVTLLIIIGVTNLSKSKASLDHIVNYNNLKIQLVHQMLQSARERTVIIQNMFIVHNEESLSTSADKMAFHGGKFVSIRSQLFKLNLSQKEKQILALQATLSRQVGPFQNKIVDLLDFGERKEAQKILLNKVKPLQNQTFKILSQLQDIQRNETKLAFQENSQNYKNIVGIMWAVSIIVILLSISIVFFTLKLISRNEKQRENYQKDIERQAFYDHLTGLPNRRLLTDRMQHAIAHTKRHEILMAVLFIDCDRFKPINDSLGHQVGDALLISIAERLEKNVRSSDSVCRISGDEFVVVLEDIEHVSIIDRITQNILDSIAEPHYLEGHKVFTSVSIGITVYPIDDQDVNGLLSSTDIAMYHAKEKGGGRFEYFDANMNAHSKMRLILEQDLHEALINNELELYYQPLHSIDSQRAIIGVEALLRWHHPKQGMILPADFINISEDTGLIVSIGEWTLLTACKQAKEWERQGAGKITLSINLSPRQFIDSNLVFAVKKALSESGLAPAQLNLEISETTAMSTISKSIEILQRLNKIGVQISLDDFGTGYSSLSYLQKMSINNLKIDRSFIQNLHHSAKDKVFVQAIVSMAHALGMKTIAEGVELEEQLSFLENINCEVAQGYLFCKPLPVDQLQSLLLPHP